MNSKKPPENKVIITDTSCFILLEKINALDILKEVFSTIITTPEIKKEYGKPLPEWVIIQPANQALKSNFQQYVDEGEASAISLAFEIPCDFVILDDIAARKLAQKLGLPIKGTIGVLLIAKQSGVIPFFSPYLKLIQQTNFRLSPQLAQQFLIDAGE